MYLHQVIESFMITKLSTLIIVTEITLMQCMMDMLRKITKHDEVISIVDLLAFMITKDLQDIEIKMLLIVMYDGENSTHLFGQDDMLIRLVWQTEQFPVIRSMDLIMMKETLNESNE